MHRSRRRSRRSLVLPACILSLAILGTIGPAGTTLRAQSVAGENAADPGAKLAALKGEYEEAQLAFLRLYRQADSPAERQRLLAERYPHPELFLPRFWQLVEAHPGHAAAAEALAWIAASASAPVERERAIRALTRGFLKSPHLVEALVTLGDDPPTLTAERFLRGVIEHNPDRVLVGQARFDLAQVLLGYGRMHRELADAREGAASLEHYVAFCGQETVDHVRSQDPEKMEQEAVLLLEPLVSEYEDVERGDGSLAEAARAVLFEFRHLQEGKRAPDVLGQDVHGKRLLLSESLGKVVVVCFWGDWSDRCRDLYPTLRRLQSRLAGQPFVIMGVNSDQDRERLRRTLAEQELTWRSIWDGGSTRGPIARQWNIRDWPTIYVLDREGIIRHRELAPSALPRAVGLLLGEMGIRVDLGEEQEG